MTSLFNAMNAANVRTANGCLTNETSFNKNLDLFSVIGSSRGQCMNHKFQQAWNEDSEMASRLVQWTRDCRGGAGEREIARRILRDMSTNVNQLPVALAILRKLPVLGYWKDVVNLWNVQQFRPTIIEMVAVALAAGDGLCAKYMPRKGIVAAEMRKALGLEAREYRKLLVSMSDTVEQKMCAKNWNEIDFGKIPSLAAARYQKAFMKNAEANYNKYLKALEKGEAKINASTLFPYDCLKSLRAGGAAANAQWNALPNYMEGTDERVMALIDVSGSMCTPTAINGISAMDAAISIGMYISERSPGVFKDQFMTFESNVRMMEAKGTLQQRIQTISRAPWGGSTNIQKAFDVMLDRAVRYGVPQDQMPTMLVILSDMEFDENARYDRNKTAFQAIDGKYARAGYKRPKLVFWNLAQRANRKNSPVTMGDGGTAMVSGLSPAILTSVLSAKDFNPYQIMLDTLMVDKYAL